MKQVLEISDSDVGLEVKEVEYRPRTTARAILNNNGKIALLHVTKHNYYKLPGGGVEEGETIQQGLIREIKEEVGCTFELQGEVGEIIEHKSHFGIVQTSHCFLAKVLEEGEPQFTEKELKDGFEIVWVPFEEAVELVKNSKPLVYQGKFIVLRELKFLEEARAKL